MQPSNKHNNGNKFNTQNRRLNEAIEAYVIDLKKKAKNCRFGELRDELIRESGVWHNQ